MTQVIANHNHYNLLLTKLSPLILTDTNPISKHGVVIIYTLQCHIL